MSNLLHLLRMKTILSLKEKLLDRKKVNTVQSKQIGEETAISIKDLLKTRKEDLIAKKARNTKKSAKTKSAAPRTATRRDPSPTPSRAASVTHEPRASTSSAPPASETRSTPPSKSSSLKRGATWSASPTKPPKIHRFRFSPQYYEKEVDIESEDDEEDKEKDEEKVKKKIVKKKEKQRKKRYEEEEEEETEEETEEEEEEEAN